MASSIARKVRAGLVQMTSVNDVAANFRTCSQLAADAVGKGCEIVFFPECFSFIGAAAGEARVQRLERLAAQPVRHALTYSPSRCERALFTAAEQCTAALSPIAPRLASCERARRRIVHGR